MAEPELRVALHCAVRGCSVNQAANPKASFFLVPEDPDRRNRWLSLMKREEFSNSQRDIPVCTIHFRDEDIAVIPPRLALKHTADPTRHMPPVGLPTPQPSLSLAYCRTAFHMICQRGPSMIIEERMKWKLRESYETLLRRMRLFGTASPIALLEFFCQSCGNFLSAKLPEFSQIFKDKIVDSTHTTSYKVFCLSLHDVSPQAYHLMTDYFHYPPVSQLRAVHVPMSSELNDDIIDKFRIKLKHTARIDKYCSVAVNMVRLRYNLFYSVKQDKIIGFHEIDGLRSPVPARYAVVIVARGMYIKWYQPVSFALISAKQCRETRVRLSQWITKILAKLLEMGLKVKTFACTAKSKLLNEAIIRGVTVDKPYFYVNSAKIYYVYHIPHMFRLLRNHFMAHDFLFGRRKKSVAQFSHVKEFYERDKFRQRRLARKLTDSHINPSVKQKKITKYATDLLSKNVASGIDTCVNFQQMPKSAKHTVDFLTKMANLYDILTSIPRSQHMYFGTEGQVERLNEGLHFFHSLKLINREKEVKTKLLFAKGIQVTIKTVLLMFPDLRGADLKFLMTRRLSLDITEKLFRKIKTKGQKTVEPTSQRFALKFQSLYYANVIKPISRGKIMVDLDNGLRYLKVFNNRNRVNYRETGSGPPGCIYRAGNDLVRKTIEFHMNNIKGKTNSQVDRRSIKLHAREMNVIAKRVVGSYGLINILLKKCLLQQQCELIKQLAGSFEVDHNEVEEASRDGLRKPDKLRDQFLDYISKMESKFQDVFYNICTGRKIEFTIYDAFMSDNFLSKFAPCPCFPIEDFLKVFIRIRIHMTINYNNAMYRSRGDSDKIFIIPNLTN